MNEIFFAFIFSIFGRRAPLEEIQNWLLTCKPLIKQLVAPEEEAFGD